METQKTGLVSFFQNMGQRVFFQKNSTKGLNIQFTFFKRIQVFTFKILYS